MKIFILYETGIADRPTTVWGLFLSHEGASRQKDRVIQRMRAAHPEVDPEYYRGCYWVEEAIAAP